MQFSLFLSCYFPDTSRPAKEMYAAMLAQATRAEDLGFCGLTLPEHHFINILMNPNPLITAVKVADVTRAIPITTAVLVLPFLDMKRLAGEIALTDILTGGRLQLGVGRGAFPYEFERFGVPVEDSRAHFDESLEVLEALLTGEEVSWAGRYYTFAPLTIMPRPLQQPAPPIWIAALAPEAIYHSARKGYNVQTTPLRGPADLVRRQAEAFHRGVADRGPGAARPGFSMLRVCFVARDEADAKAKQRLAYGYYRRFNNVHIGGPGEVRGGAITPIDLESTVEEIAAALLIGTAEQVVEKLQGYAAQGIPEMNLNMNIGAADEEVLESMERFAAEVMPHFAAAPRRVGRA